MSEIKQNINTCASDLIKDIQSTMRCIRDERTKVYLSAMLDGIFALQERYLVLKERSPKP